MSTNRHVLMLSTVVLYICRVMFVLPPSQTVGRISYTITA